MAEACGRDTYYALFGVARYRTALAPRMLSRVGDVVPVVGQATAFGIEYLHVPADDATAERDKLLARCRAALRIDVEPSFECVDCRLRFDRDDLGLPLGPERVGCCGDDLCGQQQAVLETDLDRQSASHEAGERHDVGLTDGEVVRDG